MSEDPAKARFFILQAIRLSGAAMALFGVAVIAGKTALLPQLGTVFVAFGAIDALILPVVVARMWKSRGE